MSDTKWAKYGEPGTPELFRNLLATPESRAELREEFAEHSDAKSHLICLLVDKCDEIATERDVFERMARIMAEKKDYYAAEAHRLANRPATGPHAPLVQEARDFVKRTGGRSDGDRLVTRLADALESFPPHHRQDGEMSHLANDDRCAWCGSRIPACRRGSEFCRVRCVNAYDDAQRAGWRWDNEHDELRAHE